MWMVHQELVIRYAGVCETIHQSLKVETHEVMGHKLLHVRLWATSYEP